MRELRMMIVTAVLLLMLHCIVGISSELCPNDSMVSEDGNCKCVSPCPPIECEVGFRPEIRIPGTPDTPGSCCPIYTCESIRPISYDVPEEGNHEDCMDSSGMPRTAGDQWQDGPCVDCRCEHGHVNCLATMCKSCENSTPPQAGECCPRCPVKTDDKIIRPDKCVPLMNCELDCDIGFSTDSSGCPICECLDEGILNNASVMNGNKICPKLSDCKLNCNLANDDGGCPLCACRDSSLIPEAEETPNGGSDYPSRDFEKKIICPALSCDLHCERGLAIDEDGCTSCACNPKAGCPQVTCKKECPMGFKTNKRGCQICRCRTSCIDYRNDTHAENSKWKLDRCTTCACDQGGRLNCNRTVCSVPCKDPLPPVEGECCQVCPTKEPNETDSSSSSPNGMKGWAHVTVTVVLAVLCIGLTIHVVRGRFRGRLSPAEASYTGYPHQYYKCIPAYDTPIQQSEKIVPI